MSDLNGALRKRLRLCPNCGQPMPIIRLGVHLTGLKSQIFDIIQRGGGDGVMVDRLLAAFTEMSPSTLKAHVFQINEKIGETGHRIYGRGGRYRLIRTRIAINHES